MIGNIGFEMLIRGTKMRSLETIFAAVLLLQVAQVRCEDVGHHPGFKYSKFANEDDTALTNSSEVEQGVGRSGRQKRFIYFLCMNYPDCCDFRGKEVCGFACPVCPPKPPPVTNGCKF